MYVGNTSDGSGLHHMLYGVLDYALEEARAGFVTEIVVSLNADGSATISDNGRGLSTDIRPEEGVSAAEVVAVRRRNVRPWLPGHERPVDVAGAQDLAPRPGALRALPRRHRRGAARSCWTSRR